MTELNLGHNLVSGSVPSQLGELGSLKILDLTHNQLTGAVPSELGKLSALQVRAKRRDGFSWHKPCV